MLKLRERKYTLILFSIILIFSFCFTDTYSAAITRTPRFNIKNLSLKKDSSYKLRVYNVAKDCSVIFSAGDSNIVSIKSSSRSTCRIKALSAGQTTVSASIVNEDEELIDELICNVTVTPPAISAKFCKKRVSLDVGQSRKLKVSLKPLTASEQLRFTSDNPDIVSISSNGTITAITAGQTIVRVSIANGKGGICRIKVNQSVPVPTEDPESVDSLPVTSSIPDNKEELPASDNRKDFRKKSIETEQYMS